jgi:hypothetical protein
VARPKSDNSLRAIAARLSVELGRVVTEKAVKVWKKNGYPLDDPVELEKKLRNQERAPKKTGAGPVEDDAESPPLEGDNPATYHLDVEHELKQLQRKLLKAQDYEAARTTRMQIAGVRDVLKSLREQGHYVTKESQIRDGMATGEAIKALVLKMPSDLPQQILGLDYADTVARCEDYAYALLTNLAEIQEGKSE